MTTEHCSQLMRVQKENVTGMRLRFPGRLGAIGVALLALGGVGAGRSVMAATEGAAPIEFNDQFLMRSGAKPVDISRFARGNPVAAGTYTVELYINNEWSGRVPVRFVTLSGAESATSCIDAALLKRIALNYEVLSGAAKEELDKVNTSGACLDLSRIAESAKTAYDQGELRLDMSVPQAVMQRNPRGYVSPELWSDSVPAASLGYNFNSFRISRADSSSTNAYLGLNASAHLGSWHLRHNGALSWQTGVKRNYQASQTYVQHDLPSLKSQLILGDAYTDSQVFEGLSIRGVQLASDDRMLPDSMRGYAPIIRGIAQSNAKVTVTQNGVKLHEMTVPPGAFEINDLYATGASGDLLVTVTEADGRQHSTVVPYSAIVQLLRPGNTRYSLSAGKLREGLHLLHDPMLRGTVQHGFSNLLTGYTGLTLARGYYAGLLGAALDTPIGAMSADLTHASADLRENAGRSTGQSLRLAYSKLVPATQTSFTLGAYRYSSSGFLNLRDALRERDVASQGSSASIVSRQRTQLSVSVSQALRNNMGSVWLSGARQAFWSRKGTDTQFQMGYSNSFKSLNYSVSLVRQRSGLDGQLTNQLSINLTVPLGSERNAPSASAQFTTDGKGTSSTQTRLAGTLGEDSEFGYGVNVGRSSGQDGVGANAQYASRYATFTGSASRGSDYTQMSLGASGSIVAHPGGITLGPDIGDTLGVVEAPGAAGARISSAPGVRVDTRGYAVVPYLTPYRLNTVEIDPKGLPMDVQFQTTTQQVAPRANAVVMMKFKTSVERSLLLDAKSSDGSTLPFGATVRNEQGDDLGIVGQNGRIFVRGVGGEGMLTVVWGAEKSQRCALPYKAPARASERSSFEKLSVVCELGAIPADAKKKDEHISTLTSTPNASSAHAIREQR